jgi:hypothetical protein
LTIPPAPHSITPLDPREERVALKDKRIVADGPLDARVAAAITARLVEGQLPCASAWEAARELGVQPLVIGQAADRMQVHLSACQLGFFGPACHPENADATEAAVPRAFAEALLAARGERGEISCAQLLHEAARFGVPRLEAGECADRLRIKVRHCDLGAF